MKKKICAEASIARKLQDFLDKENIDLDVVTNIQCQVNVSICDDRRESDLNTVYSGGWISCETARSLAKKINISFEQMGKLLNHLDVKIRHCSLGCFK